MRRSKRLAQLAAQAAAEKKAFDIQILDISNLLVITDYFVICSGSNTRQVRSVSDFIQEKLAKEKMRPLSVQGEREAKWVLLDYIDFVVHVFLEKEREYYQLERLWKDAPLVEWEKEAEEEKIARRKRGSSK